MAFPPMFLIPEVLAAMSLRVEVCRDGRRPVLAGAARNKDGLWDHIETLQGFLSDAIQELSGLWFRGVFVSGIFVRVPGNREPTAFKVGEKVTIAECEGTIAVCIPIVHQTQDALDALDLQKLRPFFDEWRGVR